MENRHIIGLMILATACIALVVMGGTIVDRTVKDQNYHEPSATEAAVKAFKDCIDRGNSPVSPEEGKALVEACAKMTGQTPAVTPAPATPTPSPAAKK